MSELGTMKTDSRPDLPEGYRLTELGPLPEEWRVVRLGEVTQQPRNTINPQAFAQEYFEYFSIPAYQDGGVPFLEYGRNIRSQKFLIEKGDVLFGKLNPRVPKVWLVNDSSDRRKICSTEFIVIRPTCKIESSFLYYMAWSDYILPKAQELVSGSTPSRQRVDVKAFFSLPIPLPPLPEQRAIAHVLRTVQRAKEATKQVIAAARELKKSLMHYLFTYGPVPVDQADAVEMQETEIGPLPAHWRVVRLGEVAEVRGGSAFPHRFQGKKWGEYPFFKVSDMNSYENRIWMTKAQHYVDETDLTRLRAKPFPAGTIIFPKIGGAIFTNKKRLLSADALIDNNVMGVIVREESCHRLFLFYYLESIDLRDFARIGPLPSITAQRVKDELIPLPPLDEQREIARILQAVDEKIRAEEGRRQALDVLFKTLLHHLMTGKVRVKHPAKEDLWISNLSEAS